MKERPFVRMPTPAEVMAVSASILFACWLVLPLSSRRNWFAEAWLVWLLFGTVFVLSGVASLVKLYRSGESDVGRQLDAAGRLARAVDAAVSAAVPEMEDLQVAAAPDGVVVISGVVGSEDARQRAEASARGVEGVRELIGSLTVA